ncbi:MAG: hypothetical protein D6741_03620 [Planctomycetota bacterium]|nr:MAG: hypothetical protein D6741_03620 [Planctomycetota bacterium]
MYPPTAQRGPRIIVRNAPIVYNAHVNYSFFHTPQTAQTVDLFAKLVTIGAIQSTRKLTTIARPHEQITQG